MKEHVVYFEFYGRKMKAKFIAKDENHAIEQLYSKIDVLGTKTNDKATLDLTILDEFDDLKEKV